MLRVIEGDEDVMYVWSKITNEVEKEASVYLFNRILDLYFAIRGNRFAQSVMEQYKRSEKRSVQKSKGIRKKINND